MPAQFTVPPLPFATDALNPAISPETFAQHHGGHHKAYVDKLNDLAAENDLEDEDLLTIIRETADADPDEVSEQVSGSDLFVNAAQHFNHCFFWKSLSPNGGQPEGLLLDAIERDFGSVDKLKEQMVEEGAGHFASGWLWLIQDGEQLCLLPGHDAQTPVIEEHLKPLLVIDLWEHSYYLDHKRDRKAYLKALTAKHLNWEFAAESFAAKDVTDLSLGAGNVVQREPAQ